MPFYNRDNTSSESLVLSSINQPSGAVSSDSLVLHENPPSIEESEQDILLEASIHSIRSSEYYDELLRCKENSGESNYLLYLATKQLEERLEEGNLCLDKLFPDINPSIPISSTNSITDKEVGTPFITPNISPKSAYDTIDGFLSVPAKIHGSIITNNINDTISEKYRKSTPTTRGSYISPAPSSCYEESACYESAVEESRTTDDENPIKKNTISFSKIKHKLKRIYSSKRKSKETTFANIESFKFKAGTKKNIHEVVKDKISSPFTVEGRPSLSNTGNDEKFNLIQDQEPCIPDTPNYNKFAKYKDGPMESYKKPEIGSTAESFEQFTSKLFEGFNFTSF
ncbi:hypothetical protein G6F46_007685 [Rhizopus delemar]|uniref:Uncharacterized protein n=3 Tax=Rhizopus TaxID=4842 RepID=I1BMT3_RHIO9|nr:hypothetical protein RO3G_02217 [Rhizopus delemar RA 99-880]KAG1455673.1 hypothetical protein G6F55_006936 [Rhizopus delemar]KAG1532858.1 hypothetical protein G6F51_012904 [Rhizopus arrhizus]KAG1493590.1 hypothetical protein G6F53_012730 [Rhizopus delemar]KAG1496737.1 hypothetical protein G6F54_006261 [Rhizopus delemar]|eukprot:EIE77513.1 hypothetical protein RO3G_02217 [Rhizopus delemar RA 99-880]